LLGYFGGKGVFGWVEAYAPWLAFVLLLLIGGTTFVFSAIGVFVGARCGTWLESKAEFLGGVVLILIGFKVLLF